MLLGKFCNRESFAMWIQTLLPHQQLPPRQAPELLLDLVREMLVWTVRPSQRTKPTMPSIVMRSVLRKATYMHFRWQLRLGSLLLYAARPMRSMKLTSICGMITSVERPCIIYKPAKASDRLASWLCGDKDGIRYSQRLAYASGS